jgi:DNA-directed RNA polymerase specialized sigma24 family protein
MTQRLFRSGKVNCMTLLCSKTTPGSKTHLRHATAEDVRKAFVEYRSDLEWLAIFLTGEKDMAQACIVDASTLAVGENQVFDEWLERWARRATIVSAVGRLKPRILQLGSAYERHPCLHGQHAGLTPDLVALLKAKSVEFIARLDVLSRFALVLRGMEDYSPRECALMLGVSRSALDAAYCGALDSLAILNQDAWPELDESTQTRA